MESFARSLRVSSSITSKANELLRLTQAKGHNNISQSCLMAICFDLACKRASEPVDRKLLQKLSGSSEKLYTVSLKLVEKILKQIKGYECKETLHDLAIRFGCTEVKELAGEILASYKTYFASNHKCSSIDLDDTLYLTAALYSACSIMKVSNIDKNKMIHSANSTKTMFYRVLEDMKKSIPDHLKATSSKGSKSKRKLIKKVTESVENEESAVVENMDKDEDAAGDGCTLVYSDWPTHFQLESWESRCQSNPHTHEFDTWKTNLLKSNN